MIEVRKKQELFHIKEDWFEGYWHFSFMEKVPRAVSRRACHPAAHRHPDLGRIVVVRTRVGAALRSDGNLRRRAAQCRPSGLSQAERLINEEANGGRQCTGQEVV
jgi:hypothetical protein